MPEQELFEAIEDHRRLQALRVSPEALLHEMVEGRTIKCTKSAIPPDAQVRSAGYDPYRHCFVLIIEHPSFELVAPGCHVPFIEDPEFLCLS